MSVNRKQAFGYVLYVLNNIDKLPINFLKSIFEEKNIDIDITFINSILDLSDKYQKIKQLYNKDKFQLFNTNLRKTIVQNKDEQFVGFPDVFKDFYSSLNTIVSNMKLSRRLILINSDIPKDLVSMIEKYSFEFEGVQDVEVKIRGVNCLVEIDSQRIACGLHSGHLLIINSKTGNTINMANKHQGSIILIIFNGMYIITASVNQELKFWNPETYICQRTIQLNKQINLLLSFQDLIITNYGINGFQGNKTDDTYSIAIWSPDSDTEPLYVLKGHINHINKVLIYKNKLISIAMDQGIVVWNILTGKEERDLGNREFGIPMCMVIKNDKLICGFNEGTIRIFNLKTYELEIELSNNEDKTPGSQSIYDINVSYSDYIISLKYKKMEIWKNGEVLRTVKLKHEMFNIIDDIILFTEAHMEIFNSEGDSKFELTNQSIDSIIILKDGRVAVGVMHGLIIYK